MELLATVTYPELDPLGERSLFAISLVIVFSLLTSKRILPNEKTRRSCGLIALLCLFLASLYFAFPSLGHSCDGEALALVILLAFGFMFSMRITNHKSWWCKLTGACGIIVFGGTVSVMAITVTMSADKGKPLAIAIVALMAVCVACDILRRYLDSSHKTSEDMTDNGKSSPQV